MLFIKAKAESGGGSGVSQKVTKTNGTVRQLGNLMANQGIGGARARNERGRFKTPGRDVRGFR